MMLLDAGPMVALLHEDDQHHASCVDTLSQVRTPLVTVWPAVTEAIYLLRFSADAQQALLANLEKGSPQLAALDATDASRIRELMRKYADRPMDLADACLVRVAERDRIDSIFT